MSEATAWCHVPDPQRLADLQRAFEVVEQRGGGRIQVNPIAEWNDLLHGSTDSPPSMIIVDPCARVPGPLDPVGRAEVRRRIEAVVRAHPRSAVLLYPSGSCLSLQEAIELSRVGVVASLAHADGPEWMASRLRVAGSLADGYVLIDSLVDLLGARYVALLRAALPVAYRNGNIEDEPALSVSRLAALWLPGAQAYHLDRELRREGLPAPGWIVRWTIALRATLLRTRSASWESVAVEIGFRNREKLAEFLKRLAGKPPSALRGEDLVHLFREKVGRRRGAVAE